MSTFIKSELTSKQIFSNLIYALIPILLFSLFKNSYLPYTNGYISFTEMFLPLLNILVAITTSFITELFIKKLILKDKKNTFSIFPGLFLVLILPYQVPVTMVALGSFIATLVGKMMFGGFGKNILNPALVGYVVLILFFGSNLGNYATGFEVDTVASSTPMTYMEMNSDIVTYEDMNNEYGVLNLFIGLYPGSFAETSAFLLLCSFLFLTATKTIKWKIPVVYISTVFIIMSIVSFILKIDVMYPFIQIASGGLMFGAIFMATDPVTSAVTPLGQVIQGVILGILTCIFRFIGIEGVAYSILIVNLFVRIFDNVGICARFKHALTVVISICAVILIILTGYILSDLNEVDENIDPNFEIVSKEKNGDEVTYVVRQVGYGGKIKAEIVINEIILSVNILNHNETPNRYQEVIDSNYIQSLIDNQNALEEVDTITSVTITTNALKKMLINTLEDYK